MSPGSRTRKTVEAKPSPYESSSTTKILASPVRRAPHTTFTVFQIAYSRNRRHAAKSAGPGFLGSRDELFAAPDSAHGHTTSGPHARILATAVARRGLRATIPEQWASSAWMGGSRRLCRIRTCETAPGLKAWADTYLTLHWRLRQFSLEPMPMDFVAYANACTSRASRRGRRRAPARYLSQGAPRSDPWRGPALWASTPDDTHRLVSELLVYRLGQVLG